MVLNETIISSNSFQQAKNHLNKLKVISKKIILFIFYLKIFYLAN